MTGHGTYLQIKTPQKVLQTLSAYQGAVVYAEKGATVDFSTSLSVKYTEAYEGTIAFANDRARVIVHDGLSVSYCVAFKRGLFSVSGGSQIYLEKADI